MVTNHHAVAATLQQVGLWHSDWTDPSIPPEFDPSHAIPDDPPPGFLDDDPVFIEEPDLSETPDDIHGDMTPLD
jgi:hypothetical protein